MKEEDKRRACEAIQEIETDLAYQMIEAYKEHRIEEFADALETLWLFVQVRKEVCP